MTHAPREVASDRAVRGWRMGPPPRWGRRAAAVVAIVLVVLLGAGGPAGADPAKPTNYRSTLTTMKPPTAFVRAQVVGGDGFLQMKVATGHEVVVNGYQDEPYLRFLKDGTVQENTNSPATYLNRTRYGSNGVPSSLSGDTLPAPAWKTIGHGGYAVWHDHRINFMGKDPSVVKGLAQGQPVPWTAVVFTVDGTRVVASGHYRLLDPPSPLPWLAFNAAVAIAAAVLARRTPILVAATIAAVAGAIGVVVGVEQNAAIPAGAGATPLTVILPAVAALAGIIALLRRSTPSGVIAVLASVAASGGWVLTRFSVLSKSVLPTDLSPNLDRAGTAVVLGLAVGAAILAVRSGALAGVPSESSTGAQASPSGSHP
ncbi:hypothetical protein BH10ACT1_BH10ACT1_43250 [soil metagenome]